MVSIALSIYKQKKMYPFVFVDIKTALDDFMLSKTPKNTHSWKIWIFNWSGTLARQQHTPQHTQTANEKGLLESRVLITNEITQCVN